MQMDTLFIKHLMSFGSVVAVFPVGERFVSDVRQTPHSCHSSHAVHEPHTNTGVH